MLDAVYQQLLENDYIQLQTCIDDQLPADDRQYRIKFYEYPETGNKNGPFISIRPLDVPTEALHGSDKELSISFIYQVDVQGKYRSVCKELQYNIKKELKKLGFIQMSSGLDEYFSETKRFVDARRYTTNTKIYDTYY